VTGPSEHGNEPSGSIKGSEFPDFKLLKDFATWS
jgi:hypothetical protein